MVGKGKMRECLSKEMRNGKIWGERIKKREGKNNKY